MSHSLSKKDKPTEADIAYEVLKAHGNPMHYQNLIDQVLQHLGISKEAVRIAEALTKINLDTRFAFLGRGEWGLKVWEPAKVSRRSSAVTLMNKPSEDDDDNKLEVDAEDLEYDVLDEDSLEMDESFEETTEAQSEEKW